MGLGTILLMGLWGALAASVIVRLGRAGASPFEPPLASGKRRLVGSTALYLATPAAVLLSELAQIGLLELQGVEYTFTSWVFWGIVEVDPAGALAPVERAAIAAVGPATLALFALLAFASTRWRPASAARNFLRLEIGRFTMTLSLGVHAIASIVLERGDYWTIRTSLNELSAPAGDGALLVFGVIAALAFWWFRGARGLRATATPSWDAERAARARVHETPDDPEALLHFGRTQLSAGDPAAIETLERARERRPDDPTVALWLGRANLMHGEPKTASTHLRRAGQLLEESEEDDEPLFFAVLYHLTEARLALGDDEGALLTAEAARERRPRDPLSLMLLVDALVASGRSDEAQDRLVGALGHAEGRVRREIERRLEALRRD